jgi:hypothetical protein
VHMEIPDDAHLDEEALRAHDNLALEQIRFDMAVRQDARLDDVANVLADRGAATIALTCQTLGGQRGLTARQISLAIQDAAVRLRARLGRGETLAPVDRLAAGIAKTCIDKQPDGPPPAPRLAPRKPDLLVIKGLREGTIRPNNPEMS